jgi:hypothetical protein
MAGGFLIAPGRTYRAFVRGRHAKSLYGQNVDELLHLTVAEVREKADLDSADIAEPRKSDTALFVASTALGLVVGTAFVVQALALLPLGLIAHYLRTSTVRSVRSPVTKLST